MEKGKKVARYEMDFPPAMIDQPTMHKLSKDFGVVPNILRGRITPQFAKLEVELSGTAANIKKAAAFLKTKGVTIRKLKA